MIWLLLGWLIERVQIRLCLHNYGARWNGYGCIDDVLARKAQAPMAYRVLFPWIIGAVEKVFPAVHKRRLVVLYEPLKALSLAAALAAAAQTVGVRAALLLAALLPVTFLFDYWDWAIEILGLALALSGNLPLALLGGVLLALSRETAPLVAAAYALVTHDLIGGAVIAVVIGTCMLGVRLWAGHKPLYCSRFMFRQNWEDMKAVMRNRPWYLSEIVMSMALTLATLAAVLSGKAGPAWPIPLAILAASWAMARMTETRVIAPCLLWVVMLWR